ncbi:MULTISPECIES: TraR/DksA family transcriptional regulator [Prescottella]|uniref:Dksa/trar family transcriptional regulator n=1 Tax=Rhodococcus hoagii TaxID=43767 RepID=A0AAE5IPK0_RHOHA|nr:TraR/DksA C4-type zinc finger protein [Prescottella equi]ERN47659.1 dksa/trar family transcriptional regulator [Prescottella equi NBRC 101255 = C 7]MBM4478216.1 dksa/trar family transcriptional regulator [Prescottella equi]MBM4627377.1 dksa/trar family transcriptional regulator [Prescottella equi]MBM4733743.1 dksa/trar family transcriptional regulator [Prescottella equi]MBM9839063.1 TraR/DksA C4-type zinc finger protein [Prescottella equi]
MSAPDHGARIAAERADTERRIESLSARFTAIVEGSEFTTDDDEHDPEGSTIAFERAQVAALLADARRELEELDAAVQRIEDGTYGVCARCGNLIGEARLDALPGARTCIGCAG